MLNSHYRLKELVEIERKTLGEILKHLAIINNQKTYIRLGYRSLIEYCTKALGYSESAAYRRKTALGLMRKSKKVIQKIENGQINLVKSCDLYNNILEKESEIGKRLTNTIKDSLFDIASQYSTKEANDKCRDALQLPIKMKTINIEVSQESFQKWVEFKGIHAAKRLTDEALLIYALDNSNQIKEVRSYRKATPQRSTNPRYISAEIKRITKRKASYKCQHQGCSSQYGLEIDHIKPISKGGTSKQANLQLLCRNHNQIKGNRLK